MILRIFEARVARGREGEMHELIRLHGLPELERAPGCVDAIFARRLEPDGTEISTVVSTWVDWESLQAWTSGRPTEPVYFQNQREVVEDAVVRLFEIVERTAR